MRIKGKAAGFLAAAFAAVSLMLGGCAMGAATGSKTTQGASALEEENYQLAQQLFEEAVREGEEQMLAYRGLGLANMGLGQYEQAAEAFEIALDYTDNRMPDNRKDIFLYLATAQYRMGEYEETVDTSTDLLEEAENGIAQAYFLRGAGLLHEELADDAKKDFDAAVSLTPEDYNLYLNIYECYKEMNLSGIGGEYLQKALNIQGDDTEHYYNRGRIYYYLEDYRQAQAQLIGPVEAKYEPAMYLIARVYLAQEDYEHAQGVYEQLKQEFGNSVQICNGLALCAMKAEHYDTALSYIEEGLAMETTAGKQELYFNEIVIYERMLDFQTAKAKAQEYAAQYPGDQAARKELTFLLTR